MLRNMTFCSKAIWPTTASSGRCALNIVYMIDHGHGHRCTPLYSTASHRESDSVVTKVELRIYPLQEHITHDPKIQVICRDDPTETQLLGPRDWTEIERARRYAEGLATESEADSRHARAGQRIVTVAQIRGGWDGVVDCVHGSRRGDDGGSPGVDDSLL